MIKWGGVLYVSSTHVMIFYLPAWSTPGPENLLLSSVKSKRMTYVHIWKETNNSNVVYCICCICMAMRPGGRCCAPTREIRRQARLDNHRTSHLHHLLSIFLLRARPFLTFSGDSGGAAALRAARAGRVF